MILFVYSFVPFCRERVKSERLLMKRLVSSLELGMDWLLAFGFWRT